MTSAHLELARPADAAQIGNMARCAIEHGLPWRWRPQSVAHLIRDIDTTVIVAREHAQIVGFGAMKFRFSVSEAHLLLLAVEPQRRRDGIGSEMVAWFEKIARLGGIECIALEVRAVSLGAHAFYERLGFRTVERLLGYYEHREDALRMVWSLREGRPG